MKKINYKILKVMAFSVIMLFMSSAVFAQVQESQQDTTAQDTTQMNDQQQTMPQEQNQRTGEDMKSQHPDEGVNYSETIEQSELPQEVNSSLDELYPAHKIQEAYRGEDDSFKVKVKNETDEAVVYYDAEGTFLRAENLTGLQQEGELPQEQSQQTMQQDTTGYQQDMQQDDQQETQQEEEWGAQEEDTDAEMMQEDSAAPQEQNLRTDDKLRSQDYDQGVEYNETIQESDLPQEVTSSLDELYPAHEIQELFQGNDDSYKVKVKNEDDVAVVYYDSQGDFLRAQNLSDLNQSGAMPQEQGQRIQQDKWESDTAKDESSAYPQEQNQRMMDDMHSKMHGDVDYSEKIDESELPDAVVNSIEETYPENEISEVYRGKDNSYKVKLDIQNDEPFVYYSDNGELIRAGMEEEQQASPQEMNQRIEDVEESQDADRWGTDQRTPDYEEGQDASQRSWEADTTDVETPQDEWRTESDTLKEEGSAYPQEQNQQTEGNQDEEKFEDNWGPEDMGAHQSTWEDGEGYPQEQNQQVTDEDELQDQQDQSTWMGGEGTDTTTTPSRIDTTAVYKNQWEDGTFEEGASPQEQNQQTTEWGDADTTGTQEEYGTTPVDTTDAYNDQMMEDNTLDDDTDMMDETAPQEQYQATGNEDVEYSEEIQENELPETVTVSLDELYPEYELEEAYRGEDGSYKIKVKNNEEKVAVYYDSDGLFYRDEVLDDMLEDKEKDTNQDW